MKKQTFWISTVRKDNEGYNSLVFVHQIGDTQGNPMYISVFDSYLKDKSPSSPIYYSVKRDGRELTVGVNILVVEDLDNLISLDLLKLDKALFEHHESLPEPIHI